MRRITVDGVWRVDARGTIDLPCSADVVWARMRDWRRFLRADPFHRSVHVVRAGSRSETPEGTRIVIRHRVLGFGPDRVGRVLRWEEGVGFAVSDLSRRGVRRGFPHVCSYRVESLGEGACRLEIGARGRWTARWMPRRVVVAWLWWVIVATELCCVSRLVRLSGPRR